MVFSSSIFLFLFLPIVLIVYFMLKKGFRNFFLLIASLFFYAWGEHLLVLLMVASVCVNYVFGILITFFQEKKLVFHKKLILIIGVCANFALLLYYKYASFIVVNLSELGLNISCDVSSIALPVGISFFIFQSVSYLIDVYREEVRGQTNVINLGVYIALFPQLIAGPIVRYVDISKEIVKREVTVDLFKEGISRFITGFVKKILIANNVGFLADKIFSQPVDNLSTVTSWLGVVCYSLQIYYDFSGYSDMAIGLGKMFGFNFKENFMYPYVSKSIKEFWRRWHISLSTWFKDYLYIPLGGNRKGQLRTYINLIIVFFATGLWHGASWNFVFWGIFHGVFLIGERIFSVKLKSSLSFLSHIYTLLVVMIGWVFFRLESFSDAISFLVKMFSFDVGVDQQVYLYLDSYMVIIIVFAILFSMPIRNFVNDRVKLLPVREVYLVAFGHLLFISAFLYSILELVQTTYNPFIYFRF